MNQRESQKAKILEMLKAKALVTSLSALDHAGSLRTSERIRELKADGFNISSEMIKLPNGKRVAIYKLVETLFEL